MKKIVFVLSVVLLFSINVLAAEDYYTGTDFVSSGFEGGYMMLNQGEFKTLTEDAGYPALPDGLIYYGWSSRIGSRNGLRWGLYNYEGRAKAVNADALSDLRFTAWGLTIDYGYGILDNLDVYGGISLAGSTYELTLRDGVLTDFADPNKIFVTNLLFMGGPRVGVGYKVNEWFGLQANVGYNYGVGNDQWKDGNARTDIVPPLKINGAICGLSAGLVF